jgi:hypothetical protein
VLLLAATLFAVSAITGGEATEGMWVMCAFFLLPVIGLGQAALLSQNNPTYQKQCPWRSSSTRRDQLEWYYPS